MGTILVGRGLDDAEAARVRTMLFKADCFPCTMHRDGAAWVVRDGNGTSRLEPARG